MPIRQAASHVTIRGQLFLSGDRAEALTPTNTRCSNLPPLACPTTREDLFLSVHVVLSQRILPVCATGEEVVAYPAGDYFVGPGGGPDF